MNAIIMAAGTASRFVPLSQELPKGLLPVKGEVLVERQIRQLQEAGVEDITVVVGYKAEMFVYLKAKYGVDIVVNTDYSRYNNTSSLIRVVDRLSDTFICCSDNYFVDNVFLETPVSSYYSALYADGNTNEYCLQLDSEDNIVNVSVGGRKAWYMVGHVFFDENFSKKFASLLRAEYEKEETKNGYWEDLYIKHIDCLPKMRVHRYKPGEIQEFDSIDELRGFDTSYISNTRSSIIKDICHRNGWCESELHSFANISHEGSCLQFKFCRQGVDYRYDGHLNQTIAL